MCTDDLVLQTEVEQIHHLLVLRTLISEQVLHCINIIWVPFKFETRGVSLWTSKRDLVFLPEHAPIK